LTCLIRLRSLPPLAKVARPPSFESHEHFPVCFRCPMFPAQPECLRVLLSLEFLLFASRIRPVPPKRKKPMLSSPSGRTHEESSGIQSPANSHRTRTRWDPSTGKYCSFLIENDLTQRESPAGQGSLSLVIARNANSPSMLQKIVCCSLSVADSEEGSI